MKYSVIIPVYNASTYLDACLKSILIQPYDDFEIILVDDGSTDNSLEICTLYSKKNARIKVIHQSNHGVGSARNLGLKNASGDWIVFVDSDDTLCAEAFAMFEKALTLCPNADLYIWTDEWSTAVQEITQLLPDVREQLIMATLAFPENNKDFLRLTRMPNVWSKLFRKNFLMEQQIYFPTDYVMGEDVFFMATCLNCCQKIAIVKGSFYCYRDDQNSISRGKNPQVPQKDPLRHECLRQFAIDNGYHFIEEEACILTALRGIIYCGDSYFFRFPLSRWREFRSEYDDFVSQSVYQDALCAKKRYIKYFTPREKTILIFSAWKRYPALLIALNFIHLLKSILSHLRGFMCTREQEA